MSWNWHGYLDLAIFLEQYKGEDFSLEAGQRTAASRAYYCAFQYAKKYAIAKLDFKPSNSRFDHRDLVNWFRKRGLGRKYWKPLQDLLEWREKCDYEDAVENVDQISNAAIQQTKSLVQLLS